MEGREVLEVRKPGSTDKSTDSTERIRILYKKDLKILQEPPSQPDVVRSKDNGR